jgi:DNA modification methylase
MELELDSICQGDCIDSLAKMASGTVALAFADPPFNIGYDYDQYNDRQSHSKYLNWSRKWIVEVARVLKSTGSFWLAIGDEFAAELKLIAQGDAKLSCRSWVIWYYTFGVNCTRKFNRSHAHLFHFVKSPKDFTFNFDDPAIRVPSARQLVYADSRANPNGRLPDDTWILRPQDLPEGFSEAEDTWYFPRVAGTFKERAGFHGCQMPERLLGRIIRCSSSAGDLVLDPFAGSGTTLVVAKKLGRRWLGLELSKNYAKNAAARVEAVRVGDDLEGAPEPLASAPSTSNGRALSKVNGNFKGVTRALVEAFLETHGGFSIDRVIADPELNKAFLARCREKGMEDEPVALNHGLLNLRKAKGFAALNLRTIRTRFPREEIDCYSFASEIAMQGLIGTNDLSLDDILCDPKKAVRFDEIARTYAPGYSSLQYRWAALSIRKRAKDWRKSASELSSELANRKFTSFETAASMDVKKLYGLGGVYLLKDRDRALYLGETFDLGIRLCRTLSVPIWESIAKVLRVGLIRLTEGGSKRRSDLRLFGGLKTKLISSYTPELNLTKQVE